MAIQLSLSQLLQSVSLDSWKQRLVDIATDVGLQTQNWASGGYTRILVALFSQAYKTSGDVVPLIAAGGLLDWAEGPWLTLLAKQVFNVDKIEATFASAVEGITLTNTGGGFFTFDPGDIVFKHPGTGRTYHNTSGGSLPAGDTLDLDIEADEAGADSNAQPGTITVLVTTFLGVTCTNTVALVGLDEESDPDLRQRCRDSNAARSIGGVKKAYEFFAKSARSADGTWAGVTRVLVPPADGTGTGTIYIAGAGGAITAPNVAVVQGVFDAVVTPYGFTATAASAVNKEIDAPCTIWIPSSLGLDEAAAQEKVRAALQAYVQAAPIGGFIIAPTAGRIYWRALLGVVANAIPGTLKAQLTSEADITIAANEVPIWAGLLADTTVNLVT